MRRIHLLGLIPVVAILGGALFANRARPFVLGVPFFLFWEAACVLLTCVTVGVIHHFDPARHDDPG